MSREEKTLSERLREEATAGCCDVCDLALEAADKIEDLEARLHIATTASFINGRMVEMPLEEWKTLADKAWKYDELQK